MTIIQKITKIIKNHKVIFIVVFMILVVLIALSIFENYDQERKSEINRFVASYQVFDIDEDAYSSSVLYTIADNNPNQEKTIGFYHQFANTTDDSTRLTLAENAQASLNKQLSYSSNTITPARSSVSNWLVSLNSDASAIGDNKLRTEALKITNICRQEIDILNSIDLSISDKLGAEEQLFHLVINNNGGLDGVPYQADQLSKELGKDNNDITQLGSQFSDLQNQRKQEFGIFKGLANTN